jgi:hypothetical protein
MLNHSGKNSIMVASARLTKNVNQNLASMCSVVAQKWVRHAVVMMNAMFNSLAKHQVSGLMLQHVSVWVSMATHAVLIRIVIQRPSVGINIQLMYKTISRDALTSIPRIRGLTLDGIHKLETLLMMPLSMGSFVQPAGLGTPMKEIPRNALK